MSDTQKMIEYLDHWMVKNHIKELPAVKAAEILDAAGLLKDSKNRPGLPLRNKLRDSKFPHAYQRGNHWFIPCSNGSNIVTMKSVKNKGMAKFNRTKESASKTLYAVMQEMKRRNGGISAKELYPFVEANVKLTEWEKERVGKMQYIRWTNFFQFYSISYKKAGFILKKNGTWYLTKEGENILKKSAEQVLIAAEDAYDKWKKTTAIPDYSEKEPLEDVPQNANRIELEMIESEARDSIRKYITAKDPYEFQDMVAALLHAMGYYTPFVAPKGKDGGVDIIAYVDPLGAQTPRIKVQVKHKPDTNIPATDIRALLGILRQGDIALFVTSGSFTPEAKNTSTTSPQFIRLIDGDTFIEMWQEYYDKMSDEEKNMLPLKRISFLGNNE